MKTPPFWYRDSGALEAALLAPLAVASGAFALGVAARGAAYGAGVLRAEPVGAKVVSLGNVVAGGAGKTPIAIFLAQRLSRAGRRVAVVSRGYGGAERLCAVERETPVSASGDEALLVKRRVPEAIVVVGRDRVAAARHAVSLGADVVLLDDGFQHRRLARDLDVVVVDAARPFGNGRLLPRGPLREPASALRRAGLVWTTGADGAGEGVRSRLVATALVRADGESRAPAWLAGKRVFALAGIARPERFFASVRALGAELVDCLELPDHAAISEAMAARAARADADAIVLTEKDAARWPASGAAPHVFALRVDVELLSGEARLDAALAQALA